VAPERRVGQARLLASVYAVFALAAGARSAVQLATHASDAPVPYALSALAAAIYLAAAVVLHRDALRARRALLALCAIELAGVLLVGALSLTLPDAFPDATVWSRFGSGYGFVPLVLPLLGIALASVLPRDRLATTRQDASAGI
jgi:hypothetical protein